MERVSEIQLKRKRMEGTGGFLAIESLMPVPEQVGISWCMSAILGSLPPRKSSSNI